MRVWQAYRFALDPTDRQRGRLASHAGGGRYAYNLGLQWLKTSLGNDPRGFRGAVPAAFEMHQRWNLWKQDPANGVSWWSDNSESVYQQAFSDLERAVKTFLASRNGKRRGPRIGFPRFKHKGKSRDRFQLSGPAVVGPGWVQLSALGRLRLFEDPVKLQRAIDTGGARITSASISREAQRWFVSLRVECNRESPPLRIKDQVVGLDLGIKAIATLSNGTVFAPARALQSSLTRLRRLSKAHSRKRRHSANRRKSAARLARCHARIAHSRRDHLHKLTTHLAKNHSRIVMEILNVPAMIGDRQLTRSIADAGWGELSRMLEYKCRWYGAELIRADRFFPSSKICSACGFRKERLELKERTFSCEKCGLVQGRDLNAAINLARWPAVAGSAPET
jgi:putative transposase